LELSIYRSAFCKKIVRIKRTTIKFMQSTKSTNTNFLSSLAPPAKRRRKAATVFNGRKLCTFFPVEIIEMVFSFYYSHTKLFTAFARVRKQFKQVAYNTDRLVMHSYLRMQGQYEPLRLFLSTKYNIRIVDLSNCRYDEKSNYGETTIWYCTWQIIRYMGNHMSDTIDTMLFNKNSRLDQQLLDAFDIAIPKLKNLKTLQISLTSLKQLRNWKVLAKQLTRLYCNWHEDYNNSCFFKQFTELKCLKVFVKNNNKKSATLAVTNSNKFRAVATFKD